MAALGAIGAGGQIIGAGNPAAGGTSRVPTLVFGFGAMTPPILPPTTARTIGGSIPAPGGLVGRVG